jgi:signal transduction histidine kinase
MGKRGAKKPVDLVNSIRGMIGVFEQEINKQRVETAVLGPEKFYYYAWIQDLYAVFTNLIDNSLYWMQAKNLLFRRITIEISVVDGILDYIDYRDTGPGIEPDLIESGVIFEPQFSTKPSGTGLGLAIAGEAAERNGLELKAFASIDGAWFRLQLKSEGGI